MGGRWFIVFASLTVAALTAAGVYWFRQTSVRPAAQAAAASNPVFTRAEATVPGKLRAVAVESVPVPVEGQVAEFHAEVGDEVYEGQLLASIQNAATHAEEERARLDQERAQTRVSNAEGALVSTRLEASRARADAIRAKGEFERTSRIYERQKLLLEAGATPRRTFEKAQTEFLTAQTEFQALETLAQNAENRVAAVQQELDTARRVLDERNAALEEVKAEAAAGQVLSPVSGTVVARRGQPGDDVDRSMTDLFQIATDLSRMEAVCEPEPPVLARVRPGQGAFVQIAETGEPLPGQVKDVSGNTVVVEFSNPNPLVKPGLEVAVRILLGEGAAVK